MVRGRAEILTVGGNRTRKPYWARVTTNSKGCRCALPRSAVRTDRSISWGNITWRNAIKGSGGRRSRRPSREIRRSDAREYDRDGIRSVTSFFLLMDAGREIPAVPGTCVVTCNTRAHTNRRHK